MNPTVIAERATLGALLARPRQLDTVAGWLRPSDFGHWWHTEIYRALLANPRLARRDDPVATAEQVRRHLVETLDHRRTDAPALHTLLHAAPVRPVAARYAAMVLEASIRRQVAGLSVHLLAGALPEPLASGPECADPALPLRVRQLTDVAEPLVADLGTQWAQAVLTTSNNTDGATADRTIVVDVDADDRRATRQREQALVADRATSNALERAPADVRADSQRLVAALATRPDRLDTIATWLRPEDVGRPARAVYEALLTLRQDRTRIDPVTVVWEVQRASRARGAGPDPADLLRQIEGAQLLDIDQLTGTVAQDIVRRTASTAAQNLRTAAANPGVTVPDVLDTATWATEAVAGIVSDTQAALASPTNRLEPATSSHPAAVPSPSVGGRWRRTSHLAPVRDGPDLTVVR